MYSTDPCSFCVARQGACSTRAAWTTRRSIWSVTRTDARSSARRTGMLSFPQILIDDELVGGFMELVAADRSGRLQRAADAA